MGTGNFEIKKERVRNYRTDKVTRRPAGIRIGDLSLTGRMLFRLSEPQVTVRGEWSSNPTLSIDTFTVANISPSIVHTPCTVWQIFFFEIKKEKSEKLPN